MSLSDALLEEQLIGSAKFEPLSALGQWYGGGTPSKQRQEYWQGGTIPWVSPKDMGRAVIESTQDYITEAAVAGSSAKLVPANAVAMVVRSSILDRVFPTALVPVPVALNQDMKAVAPRGDVSPEYLAYVLQSRGQAILRAARKSGGSVASIDSKKLFAFEVPVPTLEAQQDIVAALNSFAALEVELDAELAARLKQYRHYGELLLSFPHEANIPRRPLGELAKVVRGASPRPIQGFLTDSDHGVPWIKIGDVGKGSKYITRTDECVTPEGASKSRRIYPGDFVLSNSMSFGRPYISKIEGCIHDGWLAISDFGQHFLPDFLYHLLRSNPVQAEFDRRAGAGTVRNLNADIVKSVNVPVPDLTEQARIASALDKFDILVNDPAIGIPAEIRARRVQYEFYRDQLLTFERIPA